MITYMKLWDKPFRKILCGEKTIEMRLNDEKRSALSVGDEIVFTNVTTAETMRCKVLDLLKYNDFSELFKCHDKLSLGYEKDETPNPDDLLKYYSEEDIKKYGALAIRLAVVEPNENTTNNRYIAYCGLNCEKCEARQATVNDDDKLRKKVAAEWSKLNGILITPEMINCEGCRIDGAKTIYCDSLCAIRQCAMKNCFNTCGDCENLTNCDKVGMIINNNAEALNNLKNQK